jgi:prepilin-type N-terminal cleavage/methylation domain-containing protein
MNTQHHNSNVIRNGFTLIEILIVVVILGLLAATVIAQFLGATEDAERTAFIANGNIFREQAKHYQLDNGVFLDDASSGELPQGFGYYVQQDKWEGGTPIGGVWDSELNSFGLTSSLGVHFNGVGETRDDAYMQQIDAAMDDGDLATGSFRKIAGDRYYMVVVE